jgi:aspartate aminotransferase-like enzyme
VFQTTKEWKERIKMMPQYVMTPGPTEIPLSALKAMLRPAVTPGDSDFVKMFDETAELLQKVLETKNEVPFFPGSGRVAIESAIISIVDPGDRVLTINSGVFGKWIGLTVEEAGGENVELRTDWRRSVDPDDVRKKLQSEVDIKAVALVHNETMTGVINPVAEIGKIVKEYGALYLVDTVSSAAGDSVKTDEWQIDLNCTGCYKCMNCPPGLAMVAVSDEAWQAMGQRESRRSFSFDLYKYMRRWIPRERGGQLVFGYRRHVVEPVPHVTYALNEALKILLEEGLAERYRKNRVGGQAIRAAAKAMGLELYPVEERYASNTLTAILTPDGTTNTAIVDAMRKDSGVVIAGAIEELDGQLFRIAHMGFTSNEMYVMHAVRALEGALVKVGHKVEPGAGPEAAQAVFDNQ